MLRSPRTRSDEASDVLMASRKRAARASTSSQRSGSSAASWMSPISSESSRALSAIVTTTFYKSLGLQCIDADRTAKFNRLARNAHSPRRRIHVARYQLDQVSLSAATGLVEDSLQMGSDRALRHTECRCDLRHAAELDRHHHDAKLRRRQLVGVGDGIEGERPLQVSLANEQGGYRRIVHAGNPACACGE